MALQKVLARLGPGGWAATMTLTELVDEYLEVHQAEPVTIAKLRWLLGKAPLRHLGDLRHTYATFALRAGVSVFAVPRFMGSSIAMIDRHYGHLARDSREHAVSLLDALAVERAVDAGWTAALRGFWCSAHHLLDDP